MGAELTWVNDASTNALYEWKGVVGTNVGVVTCGSKTYDAVSVVVEGVALTARVGAPTTDGVPACAAGKIELSVNNWDSNNSADDYTFTFVCMVCADDTCTT